MERCVARVRKQKRKVKSPYAICYTAIMGKK